MVVSRSSSTTADFRLVFAGGPGFGWGRPPFLLADVPHAPQRFWPTFRAVGVKTRWEERRPWRGTCRRLLRHGPGSQSIGVGANNWRRGPPQRQQTHPRPSNPPNANKCAGRNVGHGTPRMERRARRPAAQRDARTARAGRNVGQKSLAPSSRLGPNQKLRLSARRRWRQPSHHRRPRGSHGPAVARWREPSGCRSASPPAAGGCR